MGKAKKDYSEIFGLIIVLIASIYLAYSTCRVAFTEARGLIVITLAFIGIGVISGVRLSKELRK